MNRLYNIILLSLIKMKVQRDFKKSLKGKKFYGELISVDINGREVKMRHHASDVKNAPVYIDIHGGGWAWGAIEAADQLLHNYCKQLHCEVYSVDYTMMPKAFYPTPLEQIYETIEYMRSNAEHFNIDPNKIIVGGRSAGGSCTASLALMAKQRGDFQFICQCLDYPFLDLTMTQIGDSERYVGPSALSVWILKLLADCYASKRQQEEIICSPLLASADELKGLPPAIIQTCELDSLRQDGELYAEHLKAAGVDVTYMCYPNVLHGFDEEDTEEAAKSQQYFIDNIKKHLDAAE